MINQNKDYNADCVIFIHQDLGIGGIEKYIYDQIIYLSQKGKIVIWICDKNRYIAKEFEDLYQCKNFNIFENRVPIIELKKILRNVEKPNINIISCYHSDFLYSIKLKNNLKWCNVNIFYFLSHFCGARFFCEEIFHNKFLNNISKKIMSQIYNRMYITNSLRFFAPIHSKIVENKYYFQIPNAEELSVPPVIYNNKFDEEHFKWIYKRHDFNIITVSRLDFPHKGFVLGLIDAFSQLRKKYNNITLTIVGDGNGMSKVKSKIESLTEEEKNNIFILGYLSPEKLKEAYLNANINISVANCCTLGATYGTLSAPARHYTYECEVYGFLPECDTVISPDTKGYSVIDMIENVLQMSENEYIEKCKLGFVSVNKIYTQSTIYNIKNDTIENIFSFKQSLLLKILYSYVMLNITIKKYLKILKQQGIISVIWKKIKNIYNLI